MRCLEIHDLVLSKLAAGRLKDLELIAVLLDRELVDLDIARERIASVPDLHRRAILMARGIGRPGMPGHIVPTEGS